MSIIILTEAGKNIGFGHLTRCVALSQAILERNLKAKFYIHCEGSIGNFAEGLDYEIYNWMENIDNILESAMASDGVIIDSYLAGKHIFDGLSEMTKGHLLMLDDYSRLEYPSGILLNPSIFGSDFDYSNIDNIEYFTGSEYIVLRKAFWDVEDITINDRVEKVCIMFGGMQRYALIDKICETLTNSFPVDIDVVDPYKKSLNASEMKEVMNTTDIVISGGGQTTYELVRTGVPSIGICLAENQQRTLETWGRLGIMDYTDNNDREDCVKDIQCLFEELLSPREREKRSMKARKIVDGQGAVRIIDHFLDRGI
jgi:UDP-2,4-diacetamido-2,4,6-trideoxy-beta-L-altropyranose hydrolase